MVWEITAEELFKRYGVGQGEYTEIDWRLWRQGAVFSNINVSGANWQKYSLENMIFVNPNFSYTNLEGANLGLSNCDNDDGYLTNNNYWDHLTGPHLEGCFLVNANLRGANLKGADLRLADLTEADLTGADLTGADLGGCYLMGANLKRAKLTRTKRTKYAIFYQTIMPNGKISRNNPKVIEGHQLLERYAAGERYFIDFILYRADLSGADLRSIYFPTRTNYVNLRNANLSGADLWPARFIGCDLSGANLSSTHLAATKFIGCDLRGANIENVLSDHILEFIEVNLQGAKLTKFDSESYYNVIWQDGIFRKGWSSG